MLKITSTTTKKRITKNGKGYNSPKSSSNRRLDINTHGKLRDTRTDSFSLIYLQKNHKQAKRGEKRKEKHTKKKERITGGVVAF